MNREYHRWHSPRLGREMELLVYGHAGKPVLVFPSSSGRFFDFENNGMVASASAFIEAGKLMLFAVDGVDDQAWLNERASLAQRGAVADRYDAYLVHEVVPFVHARIGRQCALGATGCSMGAYHSANFFLRHPDAVDWVLGLSGVYTLEFAVGAQMTEQVYFHSPAINLPNLRDAWFLERIRRATVTFCTGQGAWEELSVAEQRRLQAAFAAMHLPGRFEYWGHDVAHDWPWWRKMFPHFLTQML